MDADATASGGASGAEDDVHDRDHEIERALASVPGVSSVQVVRESADGTARLRLRLQPGQDREPVARAVAATLAERFEIALDPDAIRVATGPSRAAPAADMRSGSSRSPLVARRASITRVEITHVEGHVQVSIALRHEDQRVVGTARTRPGEERVLDAVAEATAAALRQLTLRPVGLEVREIFAEPPDAPTRVSVVVRLQAGRGDEDLLGAAAVRGDPEDAVVRATLDAVNRRVEPLLLEDSGHPPAPQTGDAAS